MMSPSAHLLGGEPDCSRVVWWRAVAGWLGEPIATIRLGKQPTLAKGRLNVLGTPAARPTTTVSVSAQGISLRLTVPSHVFPRGALERFTLRVQNVSHRTVPTYLGTFLCTGPNPSVELDDAAGNPTPQFPPGGMVNSCPVFQGYPLRPGSSWTGHVFAIMNGISVHAVLRIGRHLGRRIATHSIAIGVAEDGHPVVVVHHSKHGAYVVVPRPRGAQGPLYVIGSTLCWKVAGAASLRSSPNWTAVTGARLDSGCSGAQEWHAYAGYVGYPVATINYSQK
jgi:hypothetical protein